MLPVGLEWCQQYQHHSHYGHGMVMQVESFRVKKQTTLGQFKQMMADKWNVPVDRQRLWTWATRQNRSIRPSNILDVKDDEIRVCDVRVCRFMPCLVLHHFPGAAGKACITRNQYM